MVRLCVLVAVGLCASIMYGQTQSAPYNLSAQANLVVVPTQVKTKQGEYIYGLRAKQFVLTDNGAK